MKVTSKIIVGVCLVFLVAFSTDKPEEASSFETIVPEVMRLSNSKYGGSRSSWRSISLPQEDNKTPLKPTIEEEAYQVFALNKREDLPTVSAEPAKRGDK